MKATHDYDKPHDEDYSTLVEAVQMQSNQMLSALLLMSSSTFIKALDQIALCPFATKEFAE